MLKLHETAEAVKLGREKEAERKVLFHLTASHRALPSLLLPLVDSCVSIFNIVEQRERKEWFLMVKSWIDSSKDLASLRGSTSRRAGADG